MKLLFLLCNCLIFVICPTRLQAQQYHSMSEGNPEWIYYLQPRKNIATDASMYLAYKQPCFMRAFVGDTTKKGNHVFYRLQCEFIDMEGNLMDSNLFFLIKSTPFTLSRFREDKGLIYGIMYIPEQRWTNRHETFDDVNWEDNILFDFTLDKDDCIYVQDKNVLQYTVLDKQTIKLADDSERDITTYRCYSMNRNTYHSIEGIGFINAPSAPFGELMPFDQFNNKPTRHWWNLNCFIQNGKVVYIAPREGLDDDEQCEGSTCFRDMPFLPDITPESVASGTYTISDGLSDVTNTKSARQSIYNLQGQKRDNLQKGINIINGQKMIIK